MSRGPAIIARLRAFARRRTRNAALTEEIECHLTLLADEYRAQGMSDADARARARREFGGVDQVREAAHDAQGFPRLESLWRDAAFAIRQLRRTPSFTVAAILTLSVGVGGTTGIFSVLDLVAFRPLPYPTPERLVVIHERLPQFGPFPASAADARFWSEHATSLDEVALVLPQFGNLTGRGDPERLVVGYVSPSLLQMLGGRPRIGRLLNPGDAIAGADSVVVLSEGLWRRRFGADPGIVGQSIVLDGAPHEVVGVVDRSLQPPDISHLFAIPVPQMVAAVWKPLALTAAEQPAIGGYSYPVIARLRSGVSLEQAQQNLDAVQAELLRSVPGKGDLTVVVMSLQSQLASRSQAALLMLLAATAAVLLIGCVNTANLLSTRMLVRRREMAIRAAIGAGRGRLTRQLVVEHTVLGLLGGCGGLVLALLMMRAIVTLAPPDIPRLNEVALDTRVVAFAVVISVLSGLIIGMPSVWRLGVRDLRAALSPRTETDPGGRSYAVLVVCEIGTCAACVGVAMLLAASMRELYAVDKGFETAHVLTAELNLPADRYATPERKAQFILGAATELTSEPGVTLVAASTKLPLTGTGSLSALSAAGTTISAMERPSADVRSVTPEYFDAVSLRLREGRLLEASDQSRPVAVLSEQLAARAWPGEHAIGRQFRFGVNPSTQVYEVVGVVNDVRATALDQPVTPTAYVPFPQRAQGIVNLIVKTDGDSANLAGAVRNVLRNLDSNVPSPSFQTMDQVVSASLEARRFQFTVVAIFASLAVALAAIGVYGVMAYSVDRGRADLGVRLALGVNPRALVFEVMGRGVRLGIIGLLAAVPVGWLAATSLRSFLFGVSPFDPAALTATAAATLLLTVAAAAVPAIRASRLNPMNVLRHE